MAVGLRHPEECLVQPTAVVEVELVRLVDDRLSIGGRTEAQTAGGHAADCARLDGECDPVQDPLLAGNRGYSLGYPDAEVHDGARLQQHRGAAGDHLTRIERRRLRRLMHHPHLSGVRGVVGLGERLHVHSAACDHDAVDKHAGKADLARGGRVTGGDPLDLHDHDPTRVLRRLRDRQRVQRGGLALDRHVALLVGCRAAHERHVDGAAGIEEELFAVELDDPHHLLR